MDNILNKTQKIQLYLEYVNDYLTVEKFAEHKGLTYYMAVDMIEQGKELHNNQAGKETK